MKTIIAILLVSLLGFIGCSDSNDGATTFTGEAIPVAPFGIIDTPTPSYEWTRVPGATRYRLLVQDTNQATTVRDTGDTAVIHDWYTAEESGCASEEVLCMVTPDIDVMGANVFKVQACANDECGMWSDELSFNLAFFDFPFYKDNGDDTVTDMRTNLMWSKYADIYQEGKNWDEAQNCCETSTLAGHDNWRVPTIAELRSVLQGSDMSRMPPTYPVQNVLGAYYWTSQGPPDAIYDAYSMTLTLNVDHKSCGYIATQPKRTLDAVWCVR